MPAAPSTEPAPAPAQPASEPPRAHAGTRRIARARAARVRTLRPRLPRTAAGAGLWWPTLAVAGGLCAITFYARGGLNLASMTGTEIGLTLASAAAIAAAALLGPRGGRAFGAWPAALLLAFAALSALSIVWSVSPDDSWRDANRLFAYAALFAAAVVLARTVPGRWPALLGGVVLAACTVCAFALLTKVFPGSLSGYNGYARLQEPFGYWNAIGLMAALGAMASMWLGARRSGHAALSALAYPAMGVLLLTLLLAYSRGALVALAAGLGAWFSMVPLRLRSVAVLLPGAVCAGAVAGWAFSTHALNTENLSSAERAGAGHELGALIVVMLALLTLVGLAVGFLSAQRPVAEIMRRRAGAAMLATLALAVVVFAAALAHSHRGFTGSISHAVSSLTDPNAKTPPNTPSRLTAVASVRARYWKEALQVFSSHKATGAGAAGYRVARLRYRNETLEVRHAHGFVVQTLADLGLVGLCIVLALLLTWMAAAGRATHPFNRRWTPWRTWTRLRSGERPAWRHAPGPYTAERIGMLALLCVVIVFGVHSLVDWTWYVPANACIALLCAGWLAGRGPLAPAAQARSRTAGRERPPGAAEGWSASALRTRLRRAGELRVALACAVVAAALIAAWSQWQPQRSEEARGEALALAARHPRAALAAAQAAVSRDPLSAEALIALASVQHLTGATAAARATLQRAVRNQPSDPQTWLALGRFDLTSNPRAALQELRSAIYLNPQSIAPEALIRERQAVEIYNAYIQALRAASAPTSASAPRAPAAHAPARRRARARTPARSGSPTAGG